MDAAARRADYADARHVRSQTERISTRNGSVARFEQAGEEGIGVRVRVHGAWGFAAVRGADRPAVEAAVGRALEVAQAQPRAAVTALSDEPPTSGAWEGGTGDTDPFTVSIE